MRREILLNDDWLFIDQMVAHDTSDQDFDEINLPHSNKIFKHHNIDNAEYQTISTYRKNFDFQPIEPDSIVLVEFEGVMLSCEVFLNGQKLMEHKGGFINFKVDLTRHLIPGKNTMTVYVDSRERKDVPPYGHLVDYLTFGGIYRDVWLKILPSTYIQNVFVQPKHVLTNPGIDCRIKLNKMVSGARVKAILLDEMDNPIAEVIQEVQDENQRITFDGLSDIKLWDIDHPKLYTMKTILLKDDQEIDQFSARFGFREAEFRQDGGFYLNGKRLQLIGLNRHQTYPYIGAAGPERLQRQDAETLKFELACNIVRTSHYPQSPHFLNRCDEIGLLVFEEIAGWQHIGDRSWKQIVLDELQAMIERDFNHPAVILWGVRVNESPDDDEFYTQTNQLAHELDPGRQTGGVRCFRESHLLEDVYTYNDFSNTVKDPVSKPYLITEFAGHMFPTKIWDNENRLIDHALLHTKIQNLQMGHEDIAGAIGWCAFDYATHIEFGSGDRICYHGVMDIFRLPKWAAYFYQSQLPVEQKVVLQAATHWTMGDRNAGGNNPLTVFSNCDQVEVIIGESNLGKFEPDRMNYPHLKHPPFVIYGLDEFSAWGQRRFYDLQLVGFVDGEVVAEQRIASNQLPAKLVLKKSTDHIYADGSDMVQISFFITDKFGNPLPYARNIITFELEGPTELIGESPFPMIGGQGAIYLKAGKKAGKVTLKVKADGLNSELISVEVKSPTEI